METPPANSDACPRPSAETLVRSAKTAATTRPRGPEARVRVSSTAPPSKKKVSEGRDSSDLGSGKLRSGSVSSSSKESVKNPSIMKGSRGAITSTASSSAAVPKRRNSTGSLAVVGKESSPVGSTSSSSMKGASRGAKAPPPSLRPAMHGTIRERRASLPHTRAPAIVEKKLPSPAKATRGGGGSLQKANSAKPKPSIQDSLKSGSSSLSSSNGKGLPIGRKKVSAPETQDSRLIMLPQIEVKAGDDLRMDLRGHRVRSLTTRGLNLSTSLEFLYLRDNLLSSLEGIEILKRVKVLDLSFNEFKGPCFEPLGNCKALQQLYLAGNQITSLASLPELPNLEFLSVAQNRLKSLCMASQPRLQVLAASKNKISTLKGFPYFPVLEHLRVEENPVLEVPHLEAAAILLGSTLKKFNDRDISPDEVELAKHYPPHTALCLRDGWEFCHPELAAESTFLFLSERWKDHIPPGYVLKEAFVNQPFEDDPCRCHFAFARDPMLNNVPNLKLRYQWFFAEKTPVKFAPIDNAVGEVYWPKHEDIGKCLKIECTPILEGTEYPPVFAISSAVSVGES